LPHLGTTLDIGRIYGMIAVKVLVLKTALVGTSLVFTETVTVQLATKRIEITV
jgi:hypothetical protein